ncbi:uncharacterized protein LOC100368675 [Saccoglossus kowalevskii]|uniref:Uncharacterized protein LOC100368675 n=1 Tax=Saccoglossus kowalevskii TaxID=10224 RepID=A0ABM0M7V2_SACKO|nr:PREDICTED: uncharacterized protein LOC100368675 [Saccoglossus kowalevskii]
MNNRKDENLFARLRRIAIDVKKQSVELQAIIEKPCSERDSSNVSAELTLRDMLKEVKNINNDLRCKIIELRDDEVSFDNILAASKVMYHYLQNNYHQTESFLHQYGYKQRKKSEPRNKSQVEDSEEDKENEKPSAQSQIHKNSVVEVHQETKVFQTPPRSQIPEKDELCTPKLEDFGLSRTTLTQLARMKNPDLRSPVNDNSDVHARIHNDDNAPMSLPLDDTTVTISDCPPIVTASNVHHETQRICGTPRNQILKEDKLSTPKLEDFGFSREALDLISGKEVPAVYNTPAMTSHVNVVNHDMQQQPRFYTDVDQHQYTQHKPPDDLEHSGILMTPGLWGGKHTPTETPEPSQRGHSNNLDSHKELLMLTPGLLKISGVKRGKDKMKSKSALGKLSAKPSNDVESPVPPVFMTPGMKQIKGKQTLPQYPLQSTINKEEYRVTPTAPELQSYAISAPTRTPSPFMMTTVEAEDVPEPEAPEITTWIQPLPQEPERLVRESTCDLEPPKLLSFIVTNDHHNTKACTRIPQSIAVGKHKTQTDGRYISPITQQEYAQINDYLQRILTLQQCNEVVSKINALASSNGSGGHYIRSRELDLLNLGPHTNVLVLLLVRLQRIHMEKKTPTGESAYYIL